MRDGIPYLVKFFKDDEHANQFIGGKLYMNRLSYFRTLERAEDGRSDRHEATAAWLQPHDVSIQFKDHPELNVGPENLAEPVSMSFDPHSGLHIFCMSAIHTGEFEFEFIDGEFAFTEPDTDKLKKHFEFSKEGLKKLGKIAVVVGFPSEFMLRVKRAIERKGYQFASTLVEYYDPKTFHGHFRYCEIPFKKRLEFAFEREYRIVVYTNTKGQDVLEIEISDIGDISKKMDRANLNSVFSVEGVE